ncbi:MAG TPA: chemotaxis protein CheB [Polyangia bacterium]|jgi:two-component system CheB/CheR fusion protein
MAPASDSVPVPPAREDGGPRASAPATCPVVGIGASAGGLEALQEFFQHVPPASGLAFVLVQHLDPDHATLLPELVAAHATLPVETAADGTTVAPDHIYVIPPRVLLTIRGGGLHLEPAADGHGRFTIDTFLRSLAADQGENAACVILSGTGTDGSLGLRAVKDHGGMVVVQTPETAKYDGMPRSAVATGLVDAVAPAAELPPRVIEHFTYLAEVRRSTRPEGRAEDTAAQLQQIWELLAQATGDDFSRYKQATVVRRVRRRMQMLRLDRMAAYVEALRRDPREAARLYKELLIGVTQFFRDPEVFAALAREVIPALFAGKDARTDVRIWVPGCATGEEAYTLAVLALEHKQAVGAPAPVQVFGTDLDEAALAVARKGEFPAGLAQQLAPARLARYFVPQGSGYRATKELRAACIFSPHHVIQDPPFARLDLISCRNVLIYLEAEVQTRLIALFHYALRPSGYLLLGAAEHVGPAELFRTIAAGHRIFQRRDDVRATPARGFSLMTPRPLGRPPEGPGPAPRAREAARPAQSLERLLLAEYAPPGVVIDAAGTVHVFAGRTGKYLEPAAGAASHRLVDLVHESLRPALRTAIHQARKRRTTVAQDPVTVPLAGGGAQRVRLIVRPFVEAGPESELCLVVFQEVAPEPAAGGEAAAEGSPQVRALRAQLKSSEEHLQTTVEELGTANADLQLSNESLLALNEELQSANEELQSSNEELHTSQEELQSLNEELGTVNAELQQKLDQLDRANSDLSNLLRSTQIATIFLGRDLTIRRFTPAVTGLLRFREGDLGRAITDLAVHVVDGNLAHDAREVLRTLAPRERLVQLGDERAWYMLRVLPYRTVDEVIDGVVLTFIDVTALKQAEEALRSAEERTAAILASITDCYYQLDRDWRFTDVNDHALAFLGQRREELLGRPHASVFPAETRALVEERYRSAVTHQAPVHFEGQLFDVERWAEVHAFPVAEGLAVYFRDVTERRQREEELRQKTASDRAKDEFLAVMSHELRTPIAAIANASYVVEQASAEATEAARARCGHFATVIARQARHIARIVDDLLDVARFARGAIELRRTEVDAGEVVRRAVEMTAQFIAERRHELKLALPSAPIGLDADPARLEQVLVNLLNNAAKYTEPGGEITVSAARAGDECVLRVRDTGIGIAAEALPHVFDVFLQAHHAQVRAQGGLGLGLTLVQRLVELHGGRVEARSEGLGRGSEFVVRLPARPADRAARPAAAAPAPRKEALQILIVEDNADLASSLGEILSLWGHTAQVAHSGPAALALAGATTPDLVLLDLGLPEMDGYEVARRLRAALPPGAATRLVALTGYGQEEDRQRTREAGFDVHLVKPVDLPALRRVLQG